MRAEFRLPDLGEGLAEAEVVQWRVEPGDTVTLNQTLAEVETAKAIVELPSPYEGTVARLHAEAGETVAVGAVLIAFDVGTDGVGTDDDAVQPPPTAKERGAVAIAPNLVGYGAAPTSSARGSRRSRRPVAHPVVGDTAVLQAAPHDARPTPTEPAAAERPRSTPPVRAYAKRLGIDIDAVAAVHGDRLITRAEIDAYASSMSGAASSAPERADTGSGRTGSPGTTRVPVRGVRKHTAAAMTQSAFTAPHVTLFHTVDVTATVELLASLRADSGTARIGPLAMVAKAVCLALGRTPELNARWEPDGTAITRFDHVDLGIAVATERGLLVPVLRSAEQLPLGELAAALQDLASVARAGTTPAADLAGGTFSISNIGVFGVDAGTPILPPGQSGILAVGAIRRQPWEFRGEIALREMLTLSLSIDHRVVDGAEGARFLRDVADVLSEPGRALLLR